MRFSSAEKPCKSTSLSQYNNNGDASVSFHDVSQKEELLESMHNAIEEAQSSENVIITEMK